MKYIRIKNSKVAEIHDGTRDVLSGAGEKQVRHPSNIVDAWTTAALKKIGLVPVIVDPDKSYNPETHKLVRRPAEIGDAAPARETVKMVKLTVAEISARAESQLVKGDAKMARVFEDIIDALISKGTFALTDLPQPARDKIAARNALSMAEQKGTTVAV